MSEDALSLTHASTPSHDPLTADERASVSALTRVVRPQVSYELDLSDAVIHHLAIRMLLRAGHDPATAPESFRRLESVRAQALAQAEEDAPIRFGEDDEGEALRVQLELRQLEIEYTELLQSEERWRQKVEATYAERRTTLTRTVAQYTSALSFQRYKARQSFTQRLNAAQAELEGLDAELAAELERSPHQAAIALNRQAASELQEDLDALRAELGELPEVDFPLTIRAFYDDGHGTDALHPMASVHHFFVDEERFSVDLESTFPGGTARTTAVLTLVPVDGTLEEAVTHSFTEFIEGKAFKRHVDAPLPESLKGRELVAHGLFYNFGMEDDHVSVLYMSARSTRFAIEACQLAPTYKELQAEPSCLNRFSPNVRDVVACWWRSGDDCDYRDPNTGNPTNFTFPVTGHMRFPRRVAQPPRGSFFLSLTPAEGGAAILAAQSVSQGALAGFEVDGDMISWDFPAAAFPNNGALGKGGASTVWNFYLNVQLEDGSTGTGSFTSDRGQAGQKGMFIVPGVTIKYGCLAEGTLIRLPDGTDKPIESFTATGGERVLSDNRGGTCPVTGITPGTEPVPCVTVRDDRGHYVMMTEDHPVITRSRGVRLAKELELGDGLYSVDGPSVLIELGRRQYKGAVWNLDLGDRADAEAGRTTMYAGGVLVGDAEMQKLYAARAQETRRRDAPLAVLPEAWHRDLLSLNR